MDKIRIIVFWCVIFLLPCLALVIDTNIKYSNYEGRNMAICPSLFEEDYCLKFESYYKDNSPWRNEMITLDACISTFIFDDSSSEDIIKGSDGWYFYIPDELNEYKRLNLFEEEELEYVAGQINSINRSLNDENIDFYIFVAPDKSEIYSEKLPPYYRQFADTCRAAQLGDYLEKYGIHYVYAADEIINTKKCYDALQFYYKLDTHWNNLGGYLGCQILLNDMGIDLPSINELTLIETNNIGSSSYGGFDLANGLGMAAVLNRDIGYSIEGYNYSESIEYCGSPWASIDDFYGEVSSYNPNAPIKKKVLFLRDSYGTAMYPVLTNVFEQVISPHRNNIGSYEDLIQYDPDVIIWETVERSMNVPTF